MTSKKNDDLIAFSSIQNKDFLKAIFDNSIHAIMVADDYGNYLAVNQAAADMFGYTLSQLKKMKVGDLRTVTGPNAAKRYQTYLKTGKEAGELDFVRRDGVDRIARYQAVRVEKDFNLSILEDITEEKKYEEDLRLGEERAQHYLDIAGVMFISIGPDQKVTMINPKGCEILGYSKDYIIGKNWFDHFLLKENLEEVKKVFDRIISGDMANVEYYENPVLRKDGSVRVIAWHNSILRDKKGNITGLFSSGTDITEIKIAENKLKKSETRLRNVLDTTPFPLAVVDLEDNNIHYWSKSAMELFGHTADTTEKWYEIAYPDPKYRNEVVERWKPVLENAQKTGKPAYAGEYDVTCRDGSVKICELYAAFLPDQLIVTFNDITEKKKAENEVEEYKKNLEVLVAQRTEQLRSANREMEDFVYSVSHDLKAPLRSIMGFSEIISKRYKDNLKDEGLKYFNYIMEASSNMAKLIEDLLQYSRLGNKKTEQVKIGAIFKKIRANLSNDIELLNAEVIFPEPPPSIISNGTLLYQALINLVQNGIRYHRPGSSPVVEITIISEKDKIIFSVTDNGLGIEPEYHDKIFNIFQRLHSQDAYPGTGIGLAIVKKCITILGGEVYVESEKGNGSTFFIELPINQEGKNE